MQENENDKHRQTSEFVSNITFEDLDCMDEEDPLIYGNDDDDDLETGNRFPRITIIKNSTDEDPHSFLHEFNKIFNYLGKSVKHNLYQSLGSPSELEDTFYAGDYSNKVLIAGKETVEIVKTKLGLENISNVLFVPNKSALKQIEKEEYHLDDLQYDIAKAIGTQPDKLKILYITKQLNNFKKNYTNVELTEMFELISPSKHITSEKPIYYLAVTVQPEVEEYEEIVLVVAVQDLTHGSQWLGGYIDSKRYVYYHNAATQTEPRKHHYETPWSLPIAYNSRDIQTYPPHKDIGINLPIDHSTQMWRFDHYMPADTDLIVYPKQYTPFDEKYGPEARERAAIVFQKYWRKRKIAVFNKKIAEYAKQQADFVIQNYWRYYRPPPGTFIDEEGLAFDQVKEILNKPNPLIEDNRELFNRQILNIMFPYRRKDFYRLHYLINKYKNDRINELKLIENSSYRKAEIFNLLQKTNDLLQGLERQSVLVKKDALLKSGKKILEYLSAPNIKPNFDKDIFYIIDNEDVENCQQFKELYVLFVRENLSAEQRIEVLMLFIKLLESYEDFEMKDDLLELMERECLLISNGVPFQYLSDLRKRMQEIIHHFVKCSDSVLFPNKSPPIGKEIYRCKYCNKFKSVNEFPVYNRHKKFIKCKTCSYCFRATRTTVNLSEYRNILFYIQSDEYRRGCHNPYASLTHPKGVQFIIENIWGGKSIISNITHLPELRLPRWDTRKPWAPWNCILLSVEEAKVHERIDDVYEFYGDEFLNIIKYKNLKGLLEFRKLAGTERVGRTMWANLPDNAYYTEPESLLNAFILSGDSFFYSPNKKIF